MAQIPNTPQFRGGESLGRNASGASVGSALQQAGNALSGIGNEMENRLLKLKKEENDAKLLEDRGDYEMGMANFWAWTEENQDTDQWEERLSSTFDEIEERIQSKGGTNPYLDKQRSEMFTRQRAAGSVRAISKGGMLKTQQIKQTYLNTAERQSLNGNHDGAIETLQRLAETGLVHESAVEKQIIALEHEKVIAGFTGVSDAELSSTIEGLEKKRPDMMSKTDQVNLLRSLKRRENVMIGEEMDRWAEKIESSPRPMSEEMVNALVDSGKVPDRYKEKFKRGWKKSVERGQLSGKETMEYKARMRELRVYQDSSDYNSSDYVDKRNEILNDMRADGIPARSPDVWAEMSRTSLEAQERNHNAVTKAVNAETAKERADQIGYIVEYDAKRRLYEAIDRGGGKDEWEDLFSTGMGDKAGDIATLMEDKFEEDMGKWLKAYDFTKGEATLRKDLDGRVQQWFYDETVSAKATKEAIGDPVGDTEEFLRNGPPKGASVDADFGNTVSYDLKGKTRDQMPKKQLVSFAGSAAQEQGLQVKVFSGGQDSTGSKRTGSHRHDDGNAMDIQLTRNGRRLSSSNKADQDYMAKFITQAVANGVEGVGCGHGYMNGNIHLDLVGTSHGGSRTWGKGSRAANTPNWVKDAYAEGIRQRK